MMQIINNFLNKFNFHINLNGPGAVFMAGVIGFAIFTILMLVLFSGDVSVMIFNSILSAIFVILSAPAVRYIDDSGINAIDIDWAWLISRLGSVAVLVATVILIIRISFYGVEPETLLILGVIYFATSWIISSGYWMYQNGAKLFQSTSDKE